MNQPISCLSNDIMQLCKFLWILFEYIIAAFVPEKNNLQFFAPSIFFWIFDRRRIVIMTFDIIMMEENPIFAAVAVVSQWLMVNFLVKASVKFTCSPFHPSPSTKYYLVQIALSPLKSGHFLRRKFSFLANSHLTSNFW